MGEAIAVLAVLFALFVVLGVFVTIKVAKAAARGVDRTIEQARRTVEDTTLKAKTYAQPGSAGELARLRVQLRSTMRATQDALGAGAREDASLQESLRLFDRLSAHGHELDHELKRLERDPDKTRLAQRLPDLKERTDQITQAADSLRWAAHDRARNFAEDDLAELGRQIDMESGALRHWTPAGAEAGAGGEESPGSRPAAAPSWPEPTLVDGPAAPTEQTWPDGRSERSEHSERSEREAGKPAEGGPEAIEPSRPAPTYTWQKEAKPESTT
ncbi:hypothetical protein QIS99_20725 [Streptomyces sp. B-S-A8]|uniref:Secreted protein n=1 Tax=Streptomyces solicavernae TaxID=3043614 RepID=A0ABT6RVY4_9ACTN|nr:hypothetical protein [Streptomyces sp. B-S-A8]MDI3388610.1 hypothetical protein [Streptomyces sp. B-S-A8]